MIKHARPIITLGNQEQICPRWGHSICSVGNFILIFGGYESTTNTIKTPNIIMTFGNSIFNHFNSLKSKP